MISENRHNGFCLPEWLWLRAAFSAALLVGILTLPSVVQAQAYDGPQFARGLWRFERSLEVSSRNNGLPQSSHVRVEPVVIRCVDPTLAMRETFRPASVGTCSSSPPERSRNTYSFAKRCDYMGP